MEPRPILTAADVTEDVLEDAYQVFEGWFSEGAIDWEDFFERMERYYPYDFGEEMDSPAM